MAAQYDALGNYLGDWETEEERRQREEELARTAVRTQEVKTFGDGTVERVTKETAPAGVSAPVAPGGTYGRMIQAESRGQDFDAQGRPLTSPAGAMFRAQVMPSTAAQPGFGIRPAQAQTPEEYNRVGAEYYQALLKKYNGDERLAAAAYNMGPGAVDRNIAQNQGQFNVASAPKETQGYLRQVFGQAPAPQMAQAPAPQMAQARQPGILERAVNAIIPSAQAGTLPQAAQAAPAAPVAPAQAVPQAQAAPVAGPAPEAGAVSPYALSTGQTGLGLRAPGMAQPAQEPSTAYINQYQQVQDDPMQLLALRGDQSAPAFIRERAGERAYELMNQEVQKKQGEAQAKELIAATMTGDRKAANTIAKELQGQEGSWLKMLLLGFVSPTLAGEEAIKLGFGNKWVSSTDANGQQALIQVNAKGLPLKGYKADGSEIAGDDLVAFTTGGAKVTTSGTFFQTPQGQILRAQSDEQGRTRLVDAASGARYTGPTTGLTKLEEAGAIRKMDRGLVIDLAKKHGQNVLDAEAEYVKLNGPFKSPEERAQFRQAYGFSLAQPAPVAGVAGFPGQAQPQSPAGGPVAPQAGAPMAPAPQGGPVAPQAVPAPGPAAPAPAALPPTGAAPSGVTAPIAGMQTGVAINKQQQEAFVKYAAEDITPKADAGGQVARIRKEQIKGPDGILNNPEIAGLLQGGRSGEVYNIIRDLVSGNFKDQADLSARVESLGLTPRQKDILYRQINLSTQVAPLTLKANAGAGSVSDAEQKANRAANIDITRQPLYAGLADLSRSQHINDMSVARADFKAANPQFQTTEQFNRAWSAEKARRQKEYDQIFEARAQYIAKYGNTPGAIVDAFKHYPTPEWNSQTGSWDLGTEFARKAARPKLNEFNR